MHGPFASSLHCFVEVRGDSFVSGLSHICFTNSLRGLGGEAPLDLLRFQVQELDLLVYSGEFSTEYLDPRFELIFDGYQFLGHQYDVCRERTECKMLPILTDGELWVKPAEDLI